MKVKSLRIKNFRSFEESIAIKLSDLNVLIGANNSGKSSILRALHQLQEGLDYAWADVRTGSTQAVVEIELDKVECFKINHDTPALYTCQLTSIDKRSGKYHSSLTLNGHRDPQHQGEIKLHNSDPNHFVVPFFSHRKTRGYIEDVRESHVSQITSNMSNLAAKLSQVANPSFPGYKFYANACEEILGFIVAAIPSINGQLPGIYLPDKSVITIDQMGDGVPNIVFMLANLAVSKNKLFLIEEPENDLHPKALKALLDLIKESSKSNQFVISTHSNIVVTHLCAESDSKLFKISCEKNSLPTTSSIQEICRSPRERVQVLQELGYSFTDYDLWEGWLLLEESSAERIIRDYLIPWFAPKLSRIKTVAAGGINNVAPMFNDLLRIVLFTHLQQSYSGLAWVRVDGDEIGKESIERLKEKFKSIPSDNFSIFDKPQFELYYPDKFKEKVEAALAIQNGKQKQEEKIKLLEEVINWIDQDISRAKIEFEKSAKGVITELKMIEEQLLAKKF